MTFLIPYSGYFELKRVGDTPRFIAGVVDVVNSFWFVQQCHRQSQSFCESGMDEVVGGS